MWCSIMMIERCTNKWSSKAWCILWDTHILTWWKRHMKGNVFSILQHKLSIRWQKACRRLCTTVFSKVLVMMINLLALCIKCNTVGFIFYLFIYLFCPHEKRNVEQSNKITVNQAFRYTIMESGILGQWDFSVGKI